MEFHFQFQEVDEFIQNNDYQKHLSLVLKLHDIKISVLNRRLSIYTDIEVSVTIIFKNQIAKTLQMDEKGLSKLAARTIFNGQTFFGTNQNSISSSSSHDAKVYLVDGSFARNRFERYPADVEAIIRQSLFDSLVNIDN